MQADRNIRTSGNRFAQLKTAGQEFMTAKAKWCFFKNTPTKFDPSVLVQLHMYNDLGRHCGFYPVSKMYCSSKNSRGLSTCQKCISRNIIIDCHDFLTDLFLISGAYYALHLSETREEEKYKINFYFSKN